MNDEKDWFAAAAGRHITVIEIGKLLGVTRNTARARLDEGLTSDEIITIARRLNLNPLTALEELEKLTIEEIWGYLDTDGQLIATAEDGELALELARRLNPATRAAELDELAARRQSATPGNDPHVQPGAYSQNEQNSDAFNPLTDVAHFYDEDAERYGEEGPQLD